MARSMTPEEASAHAAAKRAKVKALIDQALGELTNPATWQRFLASGQLMKMNGEPYSLRNQMLIRWQMPDATDVSGFGEWLSRGRSVMAGETGMLIYGPKKRVGTRGRDGEIEKRKPGEGEERAEYMGGVTVVSVFDITQTRPLERKEFKAKPAARQAALDDLRTAVQDVAGDAAAPILAAMDAALLARAGGPPEDDTQDALFDVTAGVG